MSSIAEIADALVEPTLNRAAGAFALFGHSMGALLAYEVCRRLRAEQRTLPRRLFVSGLHPPDRTSRARVRYHLDDRAFVESLRDTDEQLDGLLAVPELTQLVLPNQRADFTLCETYRHHGGEPLPCPVTAFGGTADPMVDEALLNGWRRFTSAAFEARMFPGGHFYIREHERQLVRLIGAGMQGLRAA